jgi:hypothetical protein
LVSGQVILLWGDAEKVSTRIASRQTIKQPAEYLFGLQDRLRSAVYDASGVRQLHSTDFSILALVRAVVAIIHLEAYAATDLDAQIEKLAPH